MLTMGVGRAELPRATRGLRDRRRGVGGSPVSAAEARLEAGDSAHPPPPEAIFIHIGGPRTPQ